MISNTVFMDQEVSGAIASDTLASVSAFDLVARVLAFDFDTVSPYIR
jgi:hypothetical protein